MTEIMSTGRDHGPAELKDNDDGLGADDPHAESPTDKSVSPEAICTVLQFAHLGSESDVTKEQVSMLIDKHNWDPKPDMFKVCNLTIIEKNQFQRFNHLLVRSAPGRNDTLGTAKDCALCLSNDD